MGYISFDVRKGWYPGVYREELVHERDRMVQQILTQIQNLSLVTTFGERWEFFRLFRILLVMQYDLNSSERLTIAVSFYDWIIDSFSRDIWAHTESITLFHQFLSLYRPIHGLIIPWKPLYHLLRDHHIHPKEVAAPESHSVALARLITSLRTYFAPGSANEILIEFRSAMCRYDLTVFSTQAVLCHFIPSFLHSWWYGKDKIISCSPQESTEIIKSQKTITKGFWMEEIIGMWNWEENNIDWDSLWLELISRTSNSGHCLPSPLYKQVRHAAKPNTPTTLQNISISTSIHWSSDEERILQTFRLLTSSNPLNASLPLPLPSACSENDKFLWKLFEKQFETDDHSMSCKLIGIPSPRWSLYFEFLYTKFHTVLTSQINTSPYGKGHKEYFPAYLTFLMRNTSHSDLHSISYFIIQTFTAPPFLLPSEEKPPFIYFKRLMKYLEPFFHPSSDGAWQSTLCYFLKYLCVEFASRLGSEMKQKKKLKRILSLLHQDIENEGRSEDNDRKYCILRLEEIRHHYFFLTSEDITSFSLVVIPLLQKAMYTKTGNVAAMKALQVMAYISPDLILPDFVGGVFSDLETFTQTHRTTTALLSLAFVTPLLFSPEYHLRGGPHLEALLRCTLPGIDPNDQSKTHLTLRFYYALLNAIPLSAPSFSISASLANILPNENHHPFIIDPNNEYMIRQSVQCTSYFDEWAMEFLERILAMFALLYARISDEELTNNLQNTMALLIQQSSSALYDKLKKRIFEFSVQNNLEFAVDSIATLCGNLAIVSPCSILELFFPYFFDQFVSLEDPAHPTLHACSNSEYIWGLSILSNIFANSGSSILMYQRKLSILLDLLIIPTKKNETSHSGPSTKVVKFASKLLRCTIKSLVRIYIIESRSLPPSEWNTMASNNDIYSFINMWGRSGDYKDLHVSWHIPTPEELTYGIELTNRYGIWALEELQSFSMNSNQSISSTSGRRRVRECLELVRMLFQSTGELCLYARKYEVPSTADKEYMAEFGDQIPSHEVVGPSLSCDDFSVELMFSFDKIAETLHLLCGHLIGDGHACDDTQTLSLLIDTIGTLFSPPYGYKQQQRTKASTQSNFATNPLDEKELPRHVYVHLALLQHLHRVQFYRGPVSAAIWRIVEDLLTLSLHPYSIIRKNAQDKFSSAVMRYQLPREVLTHRILTIWADTTQPEHTIIGSCHLLVRECILYMVFEDWKLLHYFILCAIKVHENSSLKSQDLILATLIIYEQCMFPLTIEVSISGKESLAMKKTEENRNCFQIICRAIASSVITLSWSYQERFLHIIYQLLLFNPREVPPVEISHFLLLTMQSDVVTIRSAAIVCITQILSNIKMSRPRRKVISPIDAARISLLQQEFQADPSSQPCSFQEWENTIFIDSHGYGWNGEAPEHKEYLALTENEHNDFIAAREGSLPFTKYQNFCEERKYNANEVIYQSRKLLADQFTKIEFWHIVFEGWSQETRQAESGYSTTYASFFKTTISQFPKMMKILGPEIAALVAQEDQIEAQCLAAEIIGGIIRSSKHWPFPMIQEMRTFVIPFLDTALSTSFFDCWQEIGYYAYDAVDFRRGEWMFSYYIGKVQKMMESPSGSSIRIGHALDGLSSLISCFTWRIAKIGDIYLRDLLCHEYLYDAPMLVRLKIGEVMQQLLTILYGGSRDPQTNIPHVPKTLDQPTTQLLIVPNGPLTRLLSRIADDILGQTLTPISIPDEDKKRNNRYIQCILTMLLPKIENFLSKLISAIFPLFPVALATVDHRDVDIAQLSWRVIGAFATTCFDLHWTERIFQLCIDILYNRFDCRQFNELEKSPHLVVMSWRILCSTLTFLQTFLNQNMFFLTPQRISVVLDCLYHCLVHSQIEVRITACSVLSSILQFVDEEKQQEMWDLYAIQASENLPLQSHNTFKEKLIKRHRAILGMAAIVNVHPYSMPLWLPSRLVAFATHIDDPLPIKDTVKQTFLSFWRVHQDSWATEKEFFSAEELSFLVELLVSPSYFV